AALRRPRGSGAGAGRPVPGRRVLREVDHRRGRGRRSLEHESGHLGDVHALQPRRGYRHPAQHVVDLARPDAEPPRGAALWLQGVDQRLHGASLHQAVLEADEDPSVRARERRGTVGSARIHRPASEALGVGRLKIREARSLKMGGPVPLPPIPPSSRSARLPFPPNPPHLRGARPAVLALAIGLLATAIANAQQLPKQVTLATNPPGTAYYAVASGLAKVVSSHAGYQMVVQPYT